MAVRKMTLCLRNPSAPNGIYQRNLEVCIGQELGNLSMEEAGRLQNDPGHTDLLGSRVRKLRKPGRSLRNSRSASAARPIK